MNLEWLQERITIEPDGCWLWRKAKNRGGYGWATVSRRQILAHRLSWFIKNGDIPHGKCVLHKCDVRHCVNPSHLFLGTRAENNKDTAKKKRTRGIINNKFNAKLSKRTVNQIRRLIGKKPQHEIAKDFNVSQSTISMIFKRRIWI